MKWFVFLNDRQTYTEAEGCYIVIADELQEEAIHFERTLEGAKEFGCKLIDIDELIERAAEVGLLREILREGSH